MNIVDDIHREVDRRVAQALVPVVIDKLTARHKNNCPDCGCTYCREKHRLNVAMFHAGHIRRPVVLKEGRAKLALLLQEFERG